MLAAIDAKRCDGIFGGDLKDVPAGQAQAVELLEHDNVAASLTGVEQEFGFVPVGFAAHVASHGLEL